MRRRIEWEITPGGFVGGALLLLVLPLRWILAAGLAAAIHELGHYLAIRLCGGKVYRIRIGVGRTVMEAEPLQPVRELICAAAGPLGSFSLLLVAKYVPAAALCGLIQGLFNLLPLFPMDGGRIVRCMIESIFPRNAEKIIDYIQNWLFLLIMCVCIWAMLRFRVWLLALVMAAFVHSNLLCKKKTLQRTQTGGTIEIH